MFQLSDELMVLSNLLPFIPRSVYDTLMRLQDAKHIIDCLEHRRQVKAAG